MAWVTPRDWTNHEFVTAAMMNTISANLDENEAAKVTAAGWTFYASAANTVVGLAPGAVHRGLKVNGAGTSIGWDGYLPAQAPVTDDGSGTTTLSEIARADITTSGGDVMILGSMETNAFVSELYVYFYIFRNNTQIRLSLQYNDSSRSTEPNTRSWSIVHIDPAPAAGLNSYILVSTTPGFSVPVLAHIVAIEF